MGSYRMSQLESDCIQQEARVKEILQQLETKYPNIRDFCDWSKLTSARAMNIRDYLAQGHALDTELLNLKSKLTFIKWEDYETLRTKETDNMVINDTTHHFTSLNKKLKALASYNIPASECLHLLPDGRCKPEEIFILARCRELTGSLPSPEIWNAYYTNSPYAVCVLHICGKEEYDRILAQVDCTYLTSKLTPMGRKYVYIYAETCYRLGMTIDMNILEYIIDTTSNYSAKKCLLCLQHIPDFTSYFNLGLSKREIISIVDEHYETLPSYKFSKPMLWDNCELLG